MSCCSKRVLPRFLSFLCLVLVGCQLSAESGAALLQSGPMVGHVDVVEATIWVQTKAPANVYVQYWSEDGQRLKSASKHTNEASYLTAKFLISDLVENTRYQYRLYINDQVVERPYAQTFKTQAHWWYRTDPPTIRFAIGSCFFVNDKPYDRPQRPYGGGFEILQTIHDMKPDFMVWLGDNVYLRESDFTPNRMNYRYRHTRSYPGLQPLLANVSHYAIWDDHDFGPNDSDRSYPLKGESLNLFKAYWANLQFGLPETPGVFGSFVWGDIQFFLLDDRYYRAPNRLKDHSKDYLGKAQLQWLKDALSGSRATFKIIVNGNQILNAYNAHESYHHFPKEHADFISWLETQDVHGLLFLSGDRHHTELLQHNRPDSYPLFEFTSSPLTSGFPRDLGRENNNPLRVPGTKVHGTRSFGMIEVTGPRRDRTLKMLAYDTAGKVLWKHELKRSELAPTRDR